MKNLAIITVAAIAIASCSNSAQKPEQKTASAAMALIGPVEKITYQHGNYTKFDRKGNIIEEKVGGEIYAYPYENPYRYRGHNGDYYNIVYNDSMRMEVWDSGTDERLSVDYLFDRRGRISSRTQLKYSDGNIIQFFYKDNERLPYQRIFNSWDDSGFSSKITETYEYTEIDKYGNWVKSNLEVKQEEWQYDTDADKTEQVTNRTFTVDAIQTISYFEKENQVKSHAKTFGKISGVINPKYIQIGATFNKERYDMMETYNRENLFASVTEVTDGAFSFDLNEPDERDMWEVKWLLNNMRIDLSISDNDARYANLSVFAYTGRYNWQRVFLVGETDDADIKVEYVYLDRNLTITAKEKREDEKVIEVNLKLKKGWNVVITEANFKKGKLTITTGSIPKVTKWIVYEK